MTTSPVKASDGQVLQRDGGFAALELTRPATIRLSSPEGDTVVDWLDADTSVAIPVGGPFQVDERSGDGSVVRLLDALYVGDLFVLAGQSNMQGSGPLRDLEEAGPLVRLFGMDRQWQAPVEPLHRMWRSPDSVHRHFFKEQDPDAIDEAIAASMNTVTPSAGAGLGIAFANEYIRLTGVPVGLLPAAYGGSSLADWAPDNLGTLFGQSVSDTPGEPGSSLYSSMVETVKAAGGKVAGLLWHQGESETGGEESAARYVECTRSVFDEFRKDLDQPDLPIYVAQIAFFPIVRTADGDRLWTAVRHAQADPDALGAQGIVATVDLTLSDPIHVDTPSQHRMGRRFARLVTGHASTIRLADVTFSGELVDWPNPQTTFEVRLHFSGVTGSLISANPSGFSVRDPDGRLVPSVWRVDLDGDVVTVRLAGSPVPGAALYHGYGVGAGTLCTITDEADMALPALGPIPLP